MSETSRPERVALGVVRSSLIALLFALLGLVAQVAQADALAIGVAARADSTRSTGLLSCGSSYAGCAMDAIVFEGALRDLPAEGRQTSGGTSADSGGNRYTVQSSSTTSVEFAATESDAEVSGIVRDAGRGKGNFGLGEASPEVADAAGEAWVGEGATTASDGKTRVSADGLRQYRPPSNKPKLGKEQANLEGRNTPKGPWQSNGHVDIRR